MVVSEPGCTLLGTGQARQFGITWSGDPQGATMTEVREVPTDSEGPIREAMQLIDRGLGDISERQLVSTSEVADLLLDVRSALSRLDPEVSPN
jgi:hypothetical protein